MALFDRIRFGRRPKVLDSGPRTSSPGPVVGALLHEGDDDLEVVGEASYQDALWSLCGGQMGERIRHQVIAVLVPEPQNPYDSNAIAVQIEAKTVGYLSRVQAAEYLPGLRDRMAQCGTYVALKGVIVGGGHYADGPGRLGVWLEHDPRHFGVRLERAAQQDVAAGAHAGSMRTGFTEAWLTDVEDDSYGLSWFDDLPDADPAAIVMLRKLLATDPDPIDRHFQYAELEARLYRARESNASALEEYDRVCGSHDAEMEGICAAFRTKWGKVPLLETYRQMAIRQQKRKDWQASLWWAERGLHLYGDDAAREESVDDLRKRRNRAVTKLEAPAASRSESHAEQHEASPRKIITTTIADTDPSVSPLQHSATKFERLVCTRCRGSFERAIVRGRKPLLCPECRLLPV